MAGKKKTVKAISDKKNTGQTRRFAPTSSGVVGAHFSVRPFIPVYLFLEIA